MRWLNQGILPLMRVWVLTLSGVMGLAMESNEANAQITPAIQYPATNLAADDYQPPAGWRLVWESDFAGEVLDPEHWSAQVEPAGRFNKEWQRYTASSDNAFIDQGCLVIKAIHESDRHGMDQYSSARLHTAGKHAWQYGRIAARMQLPYGAGMWPAFWMLGANIDENGGDTPWPQSGEIDIMEFYGSRDDAAIEVNIHYANAENKHEQMGSEVWSLNTGILAEQFHVFEIEWNEEVIVWFVDGTEVHRTSITDEMFSEFHQPYFILLNMAVGGEWSGRPDETTQFPQYLYVDWVRVYQQ